MDAIYESYQYSIQEAISIKSLNNKRQFVVVKSFNAQHNKIPNDYDIEKGTTVNVINYNNKFVTFTTDTKMATSPDTWTADLKIFVKSVK